MYVYKYCMCLFLRCVRVVHCVQLSHLCLHWCFLSSRSTRSVVTYVCWVPISYDEELLHSLLGLSPGALEALWICCLLDTLITNHHEDMSPFVKSQALYSGIYQLMYDSKKWYIMTSLHYYIEQVDPHVLDGGYASTMADERRTSLPCCIGAILAFLLFQFWWS